MNNNVDTFVRLVREYLLVIDRAADSTPHSLLGSCARLLPRIYSAAMELPDVEPETDDLSSEGDAVSPMPTLQPLFGRYDGYFEVYDPYVEDEPVMSSLADDLADIYLDLARPLGAFDAGHVADAVWSWRFNVRGHCGDHLVDALRAIHRLVNDHMPSDYVPGADI